ncbi:hypothetical protein SDC9_23493 [bioreactor metagenome]|uniref:Uncharacterized protein n=1 Tax=bioreactor metagenome TaxID=1076179 RepID=A0A644UF56_9ZZZZ
MLTPPFTGGLIYKPLIKSNVDFTDILKDLPDGENMGGLPQKVYFGFHADVATWPTKPAAPVAIDEQAVLTGDVTMKEGKRMFEMYMTDDTGEFKIEPVGESDGKSFVARLSFFHPGLSPKILGFMNAAKNDNLVFIVPDNNGNMYLMGDSLRPATYSGSPDGVGTSKETAGRRGASMEFTYKTSNIYLYEGSIPLTIAVAP